MLNFLFHEFQLSFFIVTLSLSKKMKTCKNVLFFCFVSIKLHVMQCALVCWFKNWLRMKILYVRYNILECYKYIFKQETKIEKKKIGSRPFFEIIFDCSMQFLFLKIIRKVLLRLHLKKKTQKKIFLFLIPHGLVSWKHSMSK